jgi:hypothetical protein
MKTIVAVGLTITFCAAGAEAADIRGKWGIGASVFSTGREISLIRGRSERSAWFLDLGSKFMDRSGSGPGSLSSNALSIVVGPGYRRYARTEAFSPYWDAAGHWLYLRSRESLSATLTSERYGAEGVFGFGAEYFTRWHFSIAAHSTIARVSWQHSADRIDFPPNFEWRAAGHAESISLRLSPALVLRGYF